jgi:hypothetical protein
MAKETAETRLQGEVEIDGAYFGGHVRPANIRTDRVDRRLLQNRTGKRSVIVILRQRGGRTLTRAFLREAEGVFFAQERIEPGSSVSADEVAHWDLLADRFDLRRVNHSEAYSENGVNTNLAESYFSRLRRMIRGQHHAVSGKYLASYARHAAWLEDHSSESNGALADRLIRAALTVPVSRPGPVIGSDAQADRLASSPDTCALALLDHAYKFTAGGVPQCLHNLEDDRIAQRRVRHIEIAFDHHPLGKVARRQLAVTPDVPHTYVGNLALLKEAMAYHVGRALTVRLAEQPD